ncbi:molybdenum cofactor biosynthesis protein [Candidatus Nitrospira nitrificans]|uniref:Molybdopterin synthase catalytic subunit n=1 Tax=Candidatus Nitrospira nitrificans TaxID=1742973 RepID=A0A0S4LMM7_9BACT|nr:molybdenum cofactor biosynthesis protein MoaE [Candidatus Nitrospira nitrificans]CUS37965.1 Molybdopterin synthase catalytic subunit (modular protein) [Candidatus Nitrospira nitrificans]
MMITVRLFGVTKMLAGNQGSLSLDVANGRQVKDLVGAIETSHPGIGELIQKKKVLVSVNQDIAHDETIINDGDEVALLPPFAGGSGQEPTEESQFVRVQRENFSIDQELDRVRSRSKRIGGIATFLGIARDRSRGRDVDGITFEHYEGMAQKKLREIRERALKDFDILELLVIHRYGDITIGENIVLIIAGAEHRAEAFRACRWAIDELKQITPIWKLEHTPEGEVWVEEHP